MPRRSRAGSASGIKPSPQALSIGGSEPSATITRKPCCRAAIAVASPEGPPPITKTSAEFISNARYPVLPLQEHKFGTESRPHRRQQTQSSRLRATILHHIFQNNQHGS